VHEVGDLFVGGALGHKAQGLHLTKRQAGVVARPVFVREDAGGLAEQTSPPLLARGLGHAEAELHAQPGHHLAHRVVQALGEARPFDL
jgi:hypothetical protein